MPDQTRTTKKLAERIDRGYFKHSHPLLRRRVILSAVFTALGLLLLAWYAFGRNSSPYSAGPIRSSHAVFGKNCALCHISTAAFRSTVSNDACLTCHDGPIHKAQQTFTPACSGCHVEHQGRVDLTRTTDQNCAQCHAHLRTQNGLLNISADSTHIKSFDDGHPQFAALRPGSSDPGTIKFNHAKHLKEGLLGPPPAGCKPAKTCETRVQLECSDCHRPTGGDGGWRYGQAAISAVSAPQPGIHTRQSARAYMAPVNYYEHCSACHGLQFDARFEDAVPHKKPDVVHAFLVQKYTEYIAVHPGELRAMNVEERIPTRPVTILPRTPAEWIAQRTSEAETLLWNKTCKECHSLSFPSGSTLPVVAKAAITPRWFMNANFDHQAHQMVDCASCHSRARTSELTSDVLVPGIDTCRQCHRPGDRAAAQGSCFECHTYHDWTKEKPAERKYDIHQLLSTVRSTKLSNPDETNVLGSTRTGLQKSDADGVLRRDVRNGPGDHARHSEMRFATRAVQPVW